MKIAKNSEESSFLLKTNKGYIYKSVTPYDRLNDILQYVVDNDNADFGDRFNSLEEAVIFLNNISK